MMDNFRFNPLKKLLQSIKLNNSAGQKKESPQKLIDLPVVKEIAASFQSSNTEDDVIKFSNGESNIDAELLNSSIKEVNGILPQLSRNEDEFKKIVLSNSPSIPPSQKKGKIKKNLLSNSPPALPQSNAALPQSDQKEGEFSNFDPMSCHYFSERNSYQLGPGGDLDPLVQMANLENSTAETRKSKLYVTNFGKEFDERGLRNLFSTVGTVLDVYICRKDHGRNFAFITYSHPDLAMAAIHRLHLRPPHRFIVNFARNKEDKNKYDIIDEKPLEQPIILQREYLEPLLPLELSTARSNFMKSEYMKNLKITPLDCYNQYVTRIGYVPRLPRKIVKKSSYYYDKIEDHSYEHNITSFDICVYCCNPATYFCGLCKASYCSEECQESDWPHHRLTHKT